MNNRIILSSFAVVALSALGCKDKGGGGGGGGGANAATAAEFRDSYVSLVCGELFSCAGSEEQIVLLLGTQERCEKFFGRELGRSAEFTADGDTVAFHAELTGGCLASIADLLSCDEPLPGEEEPPGCEGVFEGLLANGAACADTAQCATGYCDRGASSGECSAGVCTAFLASGAECDDEGACGELDCVYNDGQGVCGTEPADVDPVTGEACVVTEGKGRRFLSCEDSWCDYDGDQLCHAMVAPGGACSSERGSQCAGLAECIADVCVEIVVVGAGQACGALESEFAVCNPLDGHYCNGVGAAPGVCARAPVGQCVFGNELSLPGEQGCDDGFFCAASPDEESMFGTCTALRADGAACEAHVECASAECKNSRCGPC